MSLAPSPIVLITGATDGIGRQTALELAAAGAHVIVHGRSEEKVRQVVGELGRQTHNAQVDGVVFDLSSFASVRQGAEEIRRKYERISVLLNNAGAIVPQRRLTADGHETTWQVNHLAPFLLTHLLRDRLENAAPARIVNVSSMAHVRGRIAFDDLESGRHYSSYGAYAQSKLANILFTNELARRLAPQKIAAYSLHPGVIDTKLLREGFGAMGGASLQEGAATSVYLALAETVDGPSGSYFVNRHVSETAASARDEKVAQRLWDVSAQATGVGA